ncbi:MAG: hypothetical protein KatS3mg102_0221 [Planctomycetota bacterium]|nr:MAG: hypothetical protein KatS3mg102_0221 [Planctomycetota bacterium]
MVRCQPSAMRAIIEHAEEGYPAEVCGLLLGRQAEQGCTVECALRARNLEPARARERYELDPRDYLRADEQARAQGLEIVGVYHSHPDHPARPSATDRERAWEGWRYLIVAVAAGRAQQVRAWRLAGEEFLEEPIAPGPPGEQPAGGPVPANRPGRHPW